MKKVELNLPTSGKWGSIITKYSPESNYVSPDSFTSGSKDFITNLSGNLQKRYKDTQYNTTALTGPLADQYEVALQNGTRQLLFRDNDTLKVTAGDTTVSDVYAPLSVYGSVEYVNYNDIIYLDNGINNPLAYNSVGSYGGVIYLPADITITDFTQLSGCKVTIGSSTLTEGVEWIASSDNDTTAVALQAAINAIGGTPYNATVATNVVTVTNTTPTLTTSAKFSVATSGITITAVTSPRISNMGVIAPISAVAYDPASSGGSVPAGNHTYKVTFLYYGSEESNPGPASSPTTVSNPNNTVHLKNVPLGDYGVTQRNIYRDNSDGNWLLVGSIDDNTTTTFVDAVATGTTPLQITNGVPPVFGLSALFLSRIFIAKVPGALSTIYWSNAGQPDIFNPLNFIVCNPSDPITALFVYQGTLYVFNKFSFGAIRGNTDDTFYYDPIATSSIGCIDNRSIQVRVLDGYPVMLFLSAKGIYAFNGSSLQYISDPIEDFVNLNVTQANILNQSNSQNTLADWSSGTKTPGIDISTGAITLIDPISSYTGNTAWNTGTLDNVSTHNVSGNLTVPIANSPTIASGVLGGSAIAASSLTANTTATWNHFTTSSTNTAAVSNSLTRKWFRIDDFADGQFTSNPTWTVQNYGGTVAVVSNYLVVANVPGDGAGVPMISVPVGGNTGTWSQRVQLTGNGSKVLFFMNSNGHDGFGNYGGAGYGFRYYIGNWMFTRTSGYNSFADLINLGALSGWHDLRATRDSSGHWEIFVDGVSAGTVTDNNYTSNAYYVVQDNSSSGGGAYVTDIWYSPASDGTGAVTNAQGVWVGTFIPGDRSAITFTSSQTTPAGTSVTYETRTSPDNATWTSYTAVTSGNTIADPDFYVQLRITLTAPADDNLHNANLTTPTIQSVSFAFSGVVSLPQLFGSSCTGTWTSPVYDSFSDSISKINFNVVGAYPTNTNSSIQIIGASDSGMTSVVVTETLSSPSGTTNYTGLTVGARYWQIIYTLNSTDGINAPVLTAPILSFDTTGIWVSPVIDCTTDVTSYNNFNVVDSQPGTTTITYEISTSPDNITYSPYTTIALATVRRYAKIRATLTTDVDDTVSPEVTLFEFTWNLSSTFTSYAIDAGQVPSGWGVFNSAHTHNGGGVTFTFATAASQGGLSTATFLAIDNGAIPSNTLLQYMQWKVVLTGTHNSLPIITSVIVNWNIGELIAPMRVASLFYDKTYYLAAAEKNEAANNIVIALDYQGNWRIFKNININSLGLFFQLPYYLDGVRNNIYQWMILPDGFGTLPFEMTVITKSFNLDDQTHLKNVRHLWVSGKNTGTTIHAYYSVDRGITWTEMLNSVTGTVGYTSATNANVFNAYFVPDYSLGNVTSGVECIFKVTSSDAYPCEIIFIRPELYVHEGKYIGMAL